MRPRLRLPLILLLLAAFALQSALAWRLKAPTFDEHTHLAAGWSYLKTGDFRLNPEHPPLLKLWAALPLLALDLGEPANYPGWAEAQQSKFAHFFFYEAGWDFTRMFWLARLSLILLALALGLVVYFFSRSLWGEPGALLSLFLFAFSPNLLAHSAIVATDYAMASFGLLSIFLWLRMLARPTFARAALAGVGIALALLSKYSALALAPLWLFWLILACATRGRFPANLLRSAALPLRTDESIVAQASSLQPPASPLQSNQPQCGTAALGCAPDPLWFLPLFRLWLPRLALLTSISFLLPALGFGFQFRPLFEGFSHYSRHLGAGHHAFFMGQTGDQGWWNYFLVAYLVKTPIPELLLFAAGLAVAFRSGRGWPALSALLLPALYLLFLASASRVSIGYRHILLLLPLGLVAAGGILAPLANSAAPASAARRPIARLSIAAALCLWQAAGALALFPNHLTYFNEIAGGPKRGVRWLTDSNLDWGQDLTTLARWMEKTEMPWVYLAYFGMADAEKYGVRFRRLPGYNALQSPLAEFNPAAPAPGTYALFATAMTGQYLPDPNLYAFFRARQPDAVLGNSVFIYAVPGDVPPAP